MECKWWRLWISSGAIWELIDTLWNVNVTESLNAFMQSLRINRYIMECKCKIDCDWRQIASGINRYIMECKFECGRCSSVKAWELIDTLWNVNSEIHIHTENAFGINRYIMECKSFDDLDTGWDRCGINRYIMECKWRRLEDQVSDHHAN